MTANASLEYPDDLKASTWEKDRKSGFDATSDLAAKLKALQKKHDAVDWKLFADGWTHAAKTAAELEAEGSRRDKAYSTGVLPLKKEAQAVGALAKAAEKGADKSLVQTLKAIGKAAEAYAAAVDEAAAALKEAYEKAQDALPEEDDEESAPSALVNPRLLLKQLTQCRKDPERTMKFAFVDARGKDEPATLALHPRLSPRALFGKLQAATGSRTGAYGTAWVDGQSLMLQLDKPLSGLVKKLRAPVKACGFRVARIVLWAEDGKVFEQDEQAEEAAGDASAGSGAQEPGLAPGGHDAGEAFKARLATLIPRLKEAQAAGRASALDAKSRVTDAGTSAGRHDFVRANALLDEAEKLLAPSSGAPAFDEAAFRAAWKEARDGWTDAIETVDAQIARLQAVLRDQPDEDLVEIAEFGLPALTGDFKAPMMAAVMDVDRASGDTLPRAARRARSLAASFAEYLDEAQTVAVTDDNDFGVTVTIRKTIGGALRQLEQSLATAAA